MTSATGSQIGPIAYGAGKLILVIGSQEVVPDLNTALRRIEDYVIALGSGIHTASADPLQCAGLVRRSLRDANQPTVIGRAIALPNQNGSNSKSSDASQVLASASTGGSLGSTNPASRNVSLR